MKLLRSLVSGLIIIFLAMTISGTITAKAVNSLVGDPSSEENSKSTAVMGDLLNEAIVMTVSASMSTGSLGWRLPEAEVQAAVRASLKDREMADLGTQLGATFAVLSSGAKIEPGEAVLHLGAVRDSVLGGVRDLVLQKVVALPICTPQQGVSMVANPPSGIPECRSNDPAVNAAMVDQAFKGARGAIPDQVDLGIIIPEMMDQMQDQVQDQMRAEGESPSWRNSVPDLSPMLGIPLKLLRFFASWGYVALFGLILALVLLNLDTWHAQFGRVGWAALLGAGIPLIASTLAINYLPVLLTKVEGSSSSYGSLGSLIHELLMIPLQEVQALSFIITLIGVGGLVVALIGRLMSRPIQASNRTA